MNILMTTSISGRANMSRSTDRNLDNLGKNLKNNWGSGVKKVCGVPRGPLGVVGRGEEWSIDDLHFRSRNLNNLGKDFKFWGVWGPGRSLGCLGVR